MSTSCNFPQAAVRRYLAEVSGRLADTYAVGRPRSDQGTHGWPNSSPARERTCACLQSNALAVAWGTARRRGHGLQAEPVQQQATPIVSHTHKRCSWYAHSRQQRLEKATPRAGLCWRCWPLSNANVRLRITSHCRSLCRGLGHSAEEACIGRCYRYSSPMPSGRKLAARETDAFRMTWDPHLPISPSLRCCSWLRGLCARRATPEQRLLTEPRRLAPSLRPTKTGNRCVWDLRAQRLGYVV